MEYKFQLKKHLKKISQIKAKMPSKQCDRNNNPDFKVSMMSTDLDE